MAKNAVHPGMKIRRSVGDHIFNICNILFFILISIIILFPFFNIFAISLTSNVEYMREPFIIWPKEPTLESYAYIFSTSLIPRSYVLTILITISATLLSTLVTSMLDIGTMMMELAGLSFLGLGAKPPTAEWGSMMSDARSLMTTAPWVAFSPGAAIFLSVMVFNLLGDTIRDYADPRSRDF